MQINDNNKSRSPNLIGLDKFLWICNKCTCQNHKNLRQICERAYRKLISGFLIILIISSAMMATILEGMRFSFKGAYQDAIIYKNNWNFKLSEVKVQVLLFHCGLDKNVKVESADYMISEFPNVTPLIYPEEGHLSQIVNYKKEILKTFAD